jgi:hypothetical protein
MKSVQSIRPDYTYESRQWQSPSAGIEDGNPSNSATDCSTDCSEYTQPSAYYEKSDYHRELDQQFNRYMEHPSYIQDVDRSAQPQSGHRGGFPNPQDYYSQDIDWRAQQPSGDCEGEFPDSQDGDWQRSSPSEAESSDLDSLINYSPQNTPSIISTSPNQSPGRNLSVPHVDMQPPSASTHRSTHDDIWQNGSMSDAMRWTAQDRDASTVNPKDLLRARD